MYKYCFGCRSDDDENLSTVDDIVGAVRSEMTKRPKRKVKKRIQNLFSNSDSEPEPVYDSDDQKDQEYTEADALKDGGVRNLEDIASDDEGNDDDNEGPSCSSKTVRGKRTGLPLNYDPPSDIAPVLLEYRSRRHGLMREAFFDESLEKEVTWTPDENDVEEIEKCVLSRYSFLSLT